jgi:hypothetical protein
LPNSWAIAADTSSDPAARSSVVDPDAAEVAALIADPIPVKSADAAVIASGVAIRNEDTRGSQQTPPSLPRQTIS